MGPLLILGGIAAVAAILASRAKEGSDGQGQAEKSPLVNGQAYHVIVRTQTRSDAPEAAMQDLGVMAGPLGFGNLREVSADDNDPYVYRFIADWTANSGAFIGDNPGIRIVGVTPLTGQG